MLLGTSLIWIGGFGKLIPVGVGIGPLLMFGNAVCGTGSGCGTGCTPLPFKYII